ncbi:hypothetical protein IFR05_003133 [Cadophora sp. M221]|nr:hypothetical protein IFR05_003133 [Cadophora sp. M221]
MTASQMATFEAAFERLKDTVKPHHAVEFQSTTLKDVWDAANEIQRVQRQRRSLRNMGRLKPFLQGLEKYSKCLDTLCNGTPFLPWVWAPVKLILQLASDHPNVLDKLLEAYNQIAGTLPRFDRFQSAFHYDANVSQALALVYEDILEFHRNTYLFLKRGAWHIFFDSLWKDFGVRFLGILENLERHRDLVDREASAIAIIEAKKWRAKQQDNLERLEDERRDRQLQDCVSWLAIDDRGQEDALEKLSQRRQAGTCDWILKSLQLRTWVENQDAEPVLWLKGIPGAGKSVLTSHVIQNLRENLDFTTVFFFCDSRTDKVDLCSQVLRTLILELLRSQHHLTSHIFEHFARQRQTPSLGQIKKLLPDLLSAVSSVRIVIDGLDECQEKDQKAILTELLSAAKASTSTCKIFVSSRAETFISKALRKRPTISLTEKREREKVDEDIRDYVRHSLIALRDTFPGTLVDDVERTVVRKAQGMFLWVRLVISELSDRESAYELRKAAHNLPQGLHRAYRRILDRVQSEYSAYSSKKAILILQWMACSFRPLKTFEIQDGLVFAAPDCLLNDETKPNKSLLDLCKPIIEEGIGNTVDFVHFSAKEYILHQTSGPFLKECDAHLSVSLACASYLSTSQCIIDPQYSEEQQVLRVAKGFHGLHLYAHEFTLKHVLRYAELQSHAKLEFSEALATRLETLLQFEKPNIPDGFNAAVSRKTSSPEIGQQFLAANLPSNLLAFIQNLLNFQEILGQDNHQDKAPQEIHKQEIECDPTVLSQILHQYYTITEFLIETPENGISGIDSTLVRSFKDIYGDSALLCRYRPCPRASVGFSRVRDRDKHESSHTRKFECEDASCEFRGSGFSTKSALQKHTQTYHRKRDDIVLPIRRRVNTTSLRERFLDSGDSRSISDRSGGRFPIPNPDDLLNTGPKQGLRAATRKLQEISATFQPGSQTGLGFSYADFDEDQDTQNADMALHFYEPPNSSFRGTKLNLSGYKERQLKKLDSRHARHLPPSNLGFALDKNVEDVEIDEVEKTDNTPFSVAHTRVWSPIHKKRKDHPSSQRNTDPSTRPKKRTVFDGNDGIQNGDYESPNPGAFFAKGIDQSTAQNVEALQTTVEEGRGSRISGDDEAAGLTFGPRTSGLQQTMIPETPAWLETELALLRKKYTGHNFESRIVYYDAITDQRCAGPQAGESSEGRRYTHKLRIQCHDCPGELYKPGPETSVGMFEMHLNSSRHMKRALSRFYRFKQDRGEESQPLQPEGFVRAQPLDDDVHGSIEENKRPGVADDQTGMNLEKLTEYDPNYWADNHQKIPAPSQYVEDQTALLQRASKHVPESSTYDTDWAMNAISDDHLLDGLYGSNQDNQGVPTPSHGLIDNNAPPATMNVEDWFQFFGIKGDQNVLDASEALRPRQIDLPSISDQLGDINHSTEAAATRQSSFSHSPPLRPPPRFSAVPNHGPPDFDGQLGIPAFPGTNNMPEDGRRRSELQSSTAPWTPTASYTMLDAFEDELYNPNFQISSAPSAQTPAPSSSFFDPIKPLFELDPSEFSLFNSRNESAERTGLYIPPLPANTVLQIPPQYPFVPYRHDGREADQGVAPNYSQLYTRTEEGGLGTKKGRLQKLREVERRAYDAYDQKMDLTFPNLT